MSASSEVAFITGGGGAIGYGLARACLERGWRVALVDISEKAMAETATKLNAADRIATATLDVSNFDAWGRAADEVESKLGPITHLFNNAGVTSGRAALAGGDIENLSIEEWRWTNAINYDGVFYGLKTFVPRFKRAARQTHICTTASVAGVAALNMVVPVSYSASKAAVVHLVSQLRTELLRNNVKNIGLSLVYPGRVPSKLVKTSLTLSPRGQEIAAEEIDLIGHPEGIAPALIGEFVLRSIKRGDFHIFTHPEWSQNIRKYRAELDDSFKEGADPSFHDPLSDLVDLSHVSEVSG